MSKKKKIILIIALVILGLIALVRFLIYLVQGPAPETGETALKFREIPLPHTQVGDVKKSLPFMGMSTVDVDGDGVDEIAIGGGHGQQDAIYQYSENGFTGLTISGLNKDDLDATFGIASADTNGDGKEELFIARESGLYYAENNAGAYTQRKLEFGLADNTTPLSIALGDINKDGFVDIYMAGYIKLDHAEGETNFSDGYGGYSYLLLNDGSNNWKDISKEAGIFNQHNRFLAVFVDLNSDTWPDIVVAQDTGKVKIWENLKDNTFKAHTDPSDYSYPMGIGVGDIDNDGDVDLYFSNVGTTLPRFLVKGNLTDEQKFNTDYILLQNDGDFKFTDVSIAKNAAKYGFGWGTNIEDFNNDSKMDLYFSQNYARFPGAKFLKLYPGRLLEQQEDGTFLSVEESANLENPKFGITQVVSDFNKDGSLDLVIGNLGDKARCFISTETGASKGLTVRFPGTAKWLNAVGVITLPDGKKLTRQFVAGEGLCSDGFNGLHFGLGETSSPVTLTVTLQSGETKTYPDLEPGTQLMVKDSQ